MNGVVLRRVLQEARRIIDKCSVQSHSLLLFQHGMLVAMVCITAVLTDGEWLEQHDMYCLRRIDLGVLSPDHQDWARCEHNFYSTAYQDKPLPQRLHPWLYNKLRMSVHVYGAIGLLLISRAIWHIFQNEQVVAVVRDFQGRDHRGDKNTCWKKRHEVAEMLRNNGSLGLYTGELVLSLFLLVVDIILMICVLLTYNPWAIKSHLGERDLLDPNDLATTSFPVLTWCDVGHETGRLEGSYSYNCEVAANNTYVIVVVFLAAALAALLLKTLAAVFYLLVVVNLPVWRRKALGTRVALPTGRTWDLYQLGHYTTLRGFRTAIREEVRERQCKEVMNREMRPAVYH